MAQMETGRDFLRIVQEAIVLGVPAVGLAVIARGETGIVEEVDKFGGVHGLGGGEHDIGFLEMPEMRIVIFDHDRRRDHDRFAGLPRSEEHTSELQSLMRISYAVFCLKKKNKHK